MDGTFGNNKRTIIDTSTNGVIKRLKNDNINKEVQQILVILPGLSKDMAIEGLERYSASENYIDLAVAWCLENYKQSEQTKENTNSTNSSNVTNVPLQQNVKNNEVETIDNLVTMVIGIFPDVDPDYVHNELLQIWHDPYKVESLCSRMMDINANYPLLKNKSIPENVKMDDGKDIGCYVEPNMSIEDFLKIFPNPIEIFVGDKRPTVPFVYTIDAIEQLKKDFNRITLKYIRNVFAQKNQNYTLAYDELNRQMDSGIVEIAKLKSKRSNSHNLIFQSKFMSHELFYVKNRLIINNYEQNKKVELNARILQARVEKLLKTCECCYDDEVLIDEMIACPAGHLFCKSCLRKCVEVGVGEGIFKFDCFDGHCKAQFSYSIIQDLVDPKLFSNLLNLFQQDELRSADIADLVSCPFCSFCIIMPNPDDKLFRCLNPECMKETCRLCKKLNHIPLRCSEVVESLETKMRIFIENSMAEAMLRMCYNCKRRFYKVEGCNKMTCQCGAFMCYICRMPVKDYSHFVDENNKQLIAAGKCPLYTDIDKLHNEELTKAAAEARRVFSACYPEALTINLKFDPANNINDKAGL